MASSQVLPEEERSHTTRPGETESYQIHSAVIFFVEIVPSHKEGKMLKEKKKSKGQQ